MKQYVVCDNEEFEERIKMAFDVGQVMALYKMDLPVDKICEVSGMDRKNVELIVVSLTRGKKED